MNITVPLHIEQALKNEAQQRGITAELLAIEILSKRLDRNVKRENRMAIGSSASAFDDSGNETEVFKAVRKLTLTACTRKEAEFLAKLHACIRRGKPDDALIEIVERISSGR